MAMMDVASDVACFTPQKHHRRRNNSSGHANGVCDDDINVAEDLIAIKSHKRLNLSNRNLKTIPISLALECHHLRSLNLRNNNIETIPDALYSTLTQLESLDLEGNCLKSISPKITLLKRLQCLVLGVKASSSANSFDSGNEIDVLPGNLGEFLCLQYLQADFIGLREFPKSLPKSLRFLSLKGNRVGVIDWNHVHRRLLSLHPKSSSKDPCSLELEHFDCSYNEVYAINGRLPISRFSFVDCSHNKLTFIPAAIQALPNSCVVMIAANPLNAPDKTEYKAPTLEELATRHWRMHIEKEKASKAHNLPGDIEDDFSYICPTATNNSTIMNFTQCAGCPVMFREPSLHLIRKCCSFRGHPGVSIAQALCSQRCRKK